MNKVQSIALSLSASCLLGLAASATAGVISSNVITGDADSGIGLPGQDAGGVNIFGPSVTVNGVVFQADATGTGTTANGIGYALGGVQNNFNTNTGPLTGNVNTLVHDFLYDGGTAPPAGETITLTNLVQGQQYDFSEYDAAFGGAGGRNNTITDSQGGTLLFDENATPGSALHDVFTADASHALTITFAINPIGGTTLNDSYHQYDLQIATVPEPSTIAAIIGGAGMLLGLRRRRS